MPATDEDVTAMNDKYRLIMDGINLVGDRTHNRQNGLKISCYYGAQFNHMQFTGLDTGFVGSFLTKGTMEDCFFTVQKRTDIVLRSLIDLNSFQRSNHCQFRNK